MTERISPRRFHEHGWRVLRDDACTYFDTRTFAKGIELVEAIGALAEAANRHPNVDLRPEGVRNSGIPWPRSADSRSIPFSSPESWARRASSEDVAIRRPKDSTRPALISSTSYSNPGRCSAASLERTRNSRQWCRFAGPLSPNPGKL
jgi:hypothetical protein